MGSGPVAEAKAGAYTKPYGLFGREGKPYPEPGLPFVRALTEKQTVMVDDIVIHRRDGRRVHVRAFGKPLFGAGSEVELVMVSFFDITAEVDAKDKLQLAIEHAPIIIWTVDREGAITLSEGKGLSAIGFRSGELVGRSIYQVYAGQPEVAANTRRALGGEAFSTWNDLGPGVLQSWMGPLRNARGEVNGVIGVSTDVTERHRAQQ